MAGSFEIFRKYQRSLLVCVAILAMLAFFVLPPFLQMGGPVAAQDPVAVRWQGGELREGGLERTVALRTLVNRFLMEASAAAGRDPSRLPLLPEGEEPAVQTTLLSQDARDNGIVVSDAAINEFLGQITGNLVRQEQLDDILSRLRLGPLPLTQRDLFEALRTELAARTMLMLHQSALNGDPPGWQWDYFRRLEQRATVEVFPVVVEQFAADVPAPTESQLRGLYEKHKNDLPQARSADPGFREPHRVQYEYLVAKPGLFEDEEAKGVTDEQIAEDYEKNKTSMFRAKPATVSPDATGPAAAGEDTPAKTEPAKTEPAKTEPAKTEPAKTEPAKTEPAKTEPAKTEPAKTEPAKTEPKPEEQKPADPPAAAAGRRGITTVSYRQPAADTPAAPAATQPAPAVAEQAGKKADEQPPATQPDAGAAKVEDPAQFEPLEKVKDDIRQRLARERAEARIDAIFTAVAGDVARYAEDYALWQARRPVGVEAPRPPDVAKIAEKQGLASGRSELVAADAAFAAGGIGGSFDFVRDASSRFGIRQQRWLDQMYGSGSMSLRPIRSRDVEGSRYLSWRTEDQPEFTPSFETARGDVERAWRIVEGRSLARKRAEEIARQAEAKQESLETAAPAAAGAESKVTRVGPFTWLTPGMAAGGMGPTLSQPDGISMPGDEFMQAVFSLEPGRTAVAFNEPRTVCYVIRMAELEPSRDDLQSRFLAGRNDRQQIGMVAQREASTTFRNLIEGMQRRRGLEWKRQPR